MFLLDKNNVSDRKILFKNCFEYKNFNRINNDQISNGECLHKVESNILELIEKAFAYGKEVGFENGREVGYDNGYDNGYSESQNDNDFNR